MTDEIAKHLKRYRELAEIHANTDYGDSRSVRRANNAVDEMFKICLEINQLGEQGLLAFATLLDEPKNKIQLWAAHHILEQMRYTPSLECRALEIIREFSKGKGADAYGNKIWLENWESNQKKRKTSSENKAA
jgi:hypothetical protein